MGRVRVVKLYPLVDATQILGQKLHIHIKAVAILNRQKVRDACK